MNTNKHALVFPGQGSQAVGMLTAFEGIAVCESLFSEASQILQYDVKTLCADGPKETLDQTEYTQPLMLVANIARYIHDSHAAHDAQTSSVAYMLGHSVGEFAALVACGALSFQDALRLTMLRGKLMQAACPVGFAGMLAVLGLDESSVVACVDTLQSEGLKIYAANFNSPQQTVLAGVKSDFPRAMEYLKASGAKRVIELAMSVPSHCPLLAEAASAFASALNDVMFNTPTVPIIQNVDGLPSVSPDEIKSKLSKQLTLPVRWTDSVRYVKAQGIETFLECGPGQVLTQLIARI